MDKSAHARGRMGNFERRAPF